MNTTNEIKSLYNDLKDTVKYPETLLSIVIVGIIIKFIFPSKLGKATELLSDKLTSSIQIIVDIIFLFNLVACSIILILWIVYGLIYATYKYLSHKNTSSKSLAEKFHFYHRAYLGTGLRFLFVSRWLIILFCVLILFDDARIKDYVTILIKEIQSFNVFFLVVGLIVLFVLLKSVWHLLSSIFYKYFYLQKSEKKDPNLESGEGISS